MSPALVATLLLVVAGLVVCSALFSGLETALFVLRPHHLRRLEANHPSLAGFIQTFHENPRRILAIILLGSTLVNVFLIVTCSGKDRTPPTCHNGWSRSRFSPLSSFSAISSRSSLLSRLLTDYRPWAFLPCAHSCPCWRRLAARLRALALP